MEMFCGDLCGQGIEAVESAGEHTPLHRDRKSRDRLVKNYILDYVQYPESWFGLLTKIFQTVQGFSQTSFRTFINPPTLFPPRSRLLYKKRPKPAATTASTPPVTSTLRAAAAPVLVALALAALPLALPLPEEAEPEVALAAFVVVLIMLDAEEVLLATMRVVVP